MVRSLLPDLLVFPRGGRSGLWGKDWLGDHPFGRCRYGAGANVEDKLEELLHVVNIDLEDQKRDCDMKAPCSRT